MEGEFVRIDLHFFGAKKELYHADIEQERSLRIKDLFANEVKATIYIGGKDKPVPFSLVSSTLSLCIGQATVQLSLVEELT